MHKTHEKYLTLQIIIINVLKIVQNQKNSP